MSEGGAPGSSKTSKAAADAADERYVYKDVTTEYAEDFASLPLVKLALVGDSGVGKTTLALRFANREYDRGVRSTVGVDFVNAHLSVRGVALNLQIWDTAGQENYNGMTSMFVRSCGGVLIVFDASDTKSFASCKRWRALVRDINPDAVCMLVAAKFDKYRTAHTHEDGRVAPGWLDAIDMHAKAAELGCDAGFETTSGKTGDGVDHAIVKLTHLTYNKTQRRHASTLTADPDTVDLSRNTNADRRLAVNCCKS